MPPAQVGRPLQGGPGLPPVTERPRDVTALRPTVDHSPVADRMPRITSVRATPGPNAHSRDTGRGAGVPGSVDQAGSSVPGGHPVPGAPAPAVRPAPTTPTWATTRAGSSLSRASAPASPSSRPSEPTSALSRLAEPTAPLSPSSEPTPARSQSAEPAQVVSRSSHVATVEMPSSETSSAPVLPTASPERDAAVLAAAETVRVGSTRHRPGRAVQHDAAPVRRAGRPSRLVVRLGVLGALAGGTVIIPAVSQGAFAGPGGSSYDALADSTLPSTVSALTGSALSVLPPASLTASDDALVDRGVASASRDDARSILAGCDGSTRAAGQNGLLKTADLCTLWDGHTQLRADAAVSLAEFNQAFTARFGVDLCLSSGYRTLAQQRAVKAQKGGLAAAPGKSNHGWGLAVDLCQDQTSGAKWTWLNENGPTYGWQNPAWAQPGGSGPHERWHWEYVKGVKADGEYYDG
ncbi:D-alanyl-D-alanine carboxypeptidase family protein [Cellulomonas sp.]|uniref:M15 family metallopeptidase n=1 Tax=Cellulomonas sp. TaxID=40001 RepID=UPI001B2177C6|nr:D-alanyl-D-alanine carboxypeptidase family protein [Cellulomonas sp.]MBO9553790.1 D-alanyl-D-alanine carboxypeptidase family protein [Cellulomonas sp.]